MPLKFVYGSLMTHPIALKTGQGAYVSENVIRFNHIGINKWEPSFANIEKENDGKAWGVLVDFSNEIWSEIRKLEVSYGTQNITATAFDKKEYECETLVLYDQFVGADRPPSARYAKKLWDGALYHKLPDEVVKKYENFYRTGHRGTIYFGPLLYPIFLIIRFFIRRRM